MSQQGKEVENPYEVVDMLKLFLSLIDKNKD